MTSLLEFIRSLTNFSDRSWELLQPALTKKEFKKNELLLKEDRFAIGCFILKRAIAKAATSLMEL